MGRAENVFQYCGIYLFSADSSCCGRGGRVDSDILNRKKEIGQSLAASLCPFISSFLYLPFLCCFCALLSVCASENQLMYIIYITIYFKLCFNFTNSYVNVINFVISLCVRMCVCVCVCISSYDYYCSTY